MTTTVHDIGDAETITATFKNSGGTATDPTAVTFEIFEPDGTRTLYTYLTDAELVRDSAGVFHVIWTFAKEGRHTVIWKGTGTVTEGGAVEHYAKRQAA